MLEFDVTITDYILSIIGIIIGLLLFFKKTKYNFFKYITSGFFIALALSAFFGGTVHGFFPDSTSLSHLIFWKLSLIFLGLTTSFCWLISLFILNIKKKFYNYLVLIAFIIYTLFILFINHEFKIAIYYYVPSLLFLLFTFIYVYLYKIKNSNLIIGIIGILLIFIGSFIQQKNIGLEFIYITANALYHIIGIFALILLFFAFNYFLKRNIFKNI